MKKHIKGYVVLGYDNTNDKYYGIIESTFNLKCSTIHTKLFSVSTSCYKTENQNKYFEARALAETLNKNNIMNVKWKAYRINSKYCPVNIDITDVYNIMNNKVKFDKFKIRNVKFFK